MWRPIEGLVNRQHGQCAARGVEAVTEIAVCLPASGTHSCTGYHVARSTRCWTVAWPVRQLPTHNRCTPSCTTPCTIQLTLTLSAGSTASAAGWPDAANAAARCFRLITTAAPTATINSRQVPPAAAAMMAHKGSPEPATASTMGGGGEGGAGGAGGGGRGEGGGGSCTALPFCTRAGGQQQAEKAGWYSARRGRLRLRTGPPYSLQP